MTDTTNVGTAGEPGAGSTPSEPVSPQPQAPIAGDVHALLAELGGKLDSFGKELRGLQGRQDRSENQYSNFQSQLARLQSYKDQGLTDAQALAEMESDDRAEQRWQNLEKQMQELAAVIQRGGTQANPQQFVAQALTSYGLDPKDPFVAAKLAGQSPKNETEAELLAARIFRDKALAPPTNPSQQSAQPGQSAAGATDVDALAAEYDRLSENPAANFGRMEEIQKILGGIR